MSSTEKLEMQFANRMPIWGWRDDTDAIMKKQINIASKNGIDCFFIAFGQFYEGIDLVGIHTKVIMFIHDIFDIERCDNKIDYFIADPCKQTPWQRMKRVANLVLGRYARQAKNRYRDVIPLYAASNTLAYTVSDYSANALKYYFPEITKNIRICYSPLRVSEHTGTIENQKLRELVESGRKYFFMVAANRIYKNPGIVMQTFHKNMMYVLT